MQVVIWQVLKRNSSHKVLFFYIFISWLYFNSSMCIPFSSFSLYIFVCIETVLHMYKNLVICGKILSIVIIDRIWLELFQQNCILLIFIIIKARTLIVIKINKIQFYLFKKKVQRKLLCAFILLSTCAQSPDA